MSERPRVHGLLVTYRRPDALLDHLERLEGQTATLDTLLVVDNDADPAIEQLVGETSEQVAATVEYLAIPGNVGPAGAIAAGKHAILQRADDDDWLVVLDDDDPPPRSDSLDSLQVVFESLRRSHLDCVGVGLWGARLRRRGRLRVVRGDQPEAVDYLPGGACPHYQVAALRSIGAPDPALFFGFDDLDIGLALRADGGSLYSAGLARRHDLGVMVDGRRSTAALSEPTWRRYYSLRNLIVILGRHGRLPGALWMTLVGGLAKPIVHLLWRPRVAVRHLRLNWQAISDGWRRRLGKTVDPDDWS